MHTFKGYRKCRELILLFLYSKTCLFVFFIYVSTTDKVSYRQHTDDLEELERKLAKRIDDKVQCTCTAKIMIDECFHCLNPNFGNPLWCRTLVTAKCGHKNSNLEVSVFFFFNFLFEFAHAVIFVSLNAQTEIR